MATTPDDVLDFWFGRPGSADYGTSRKIWFEKNDDFDAEIQGRFGEAVENALLGGFTDWETTPADCLALIILLDQFPRNLYRGTAQAFAGDARALELANTAMDAGFDEALLPVQRIFLYLPFEHSETMADQARSVELLTAVSAQTGNPDWEAYAIADRDIIARFGRFPHRNTALGRKTTPEEAEFLKQPNSGF